MVSLIIPTGLAGHMSMSGRTIKFQNDYNLYRRRI